MTDGLSARQTQILKALIDEYIETAGPVGSENLDKKYNLGVSPATIRNEMVALTKAGYLRQPHTSSGRIPSPVAMKFYIDQLMEEKQMSLADEVKAKEEIRDSKDNLDRLLDEATRGLAERTRSVALAATDDEEFGTRDMPIYLQVRSSVILGFVPDYFLFWKRPRGYTNFFLKGQV